MNLKFRVWCISEQKMYYAGYQKLFSVLLCEDDHGTNQGRGVPVKDASYEDCEFMQATGVLDQRGVEIYEGDRVRILVQGRIYEDTLRSVPDMYKSRGLHPLHELLERLGLTEEAEMTFEILGNRYA